MVNEGVVVRVDFGRDVSRTKISVGHCKAQLNDAPAQDRKGQCVGLTQRRRNQQQAGDINKKIESIRANIQTPVKEQKYAHEKYHDERTCV
jgi:hypothetical protein